MSITLRIAACTAIGATVGLCFIAAMGIAAQTVPQGTAIYSLTSLGALLGALTGLYQEPTT